VLRELLKNPLIQAARDVEDEERAAKGIAAAGTGAVSASTTASASASASARSEGFLESTVQGEDRRNVQYLMSLDGDIDGSDDEDILGSNAGKRTVSFMVKQERVQEVKRSAKEDSRYPLMEEYDFKNDKRNAVLNIDLKASTRIRPYQEKSLSKMFGNGRARSGIIVLPCGAGKSLTGCTAASTIKRNTVIMCINNASVKQWRDELLNWTTVSKESIKLFTSGSEANDMLPSASQSNEAFIVISTYSMMCHAGKRSKTGEMMLNAVREREWGVMILDEVSVYIYMSVSVSSSFSH
jgi:DNA excision repair protein ERCC-3